MEDATGRMSREEAVQLLAYATSVEHAANEYDEYAASETMELYGFADRERVVGCIGAAFIQPSELKIRHIAVLPSARGKGYGKKMVEAIQEKLHPHSIIAETDREAVGFYRSIGFNVTSLGEKYPGVERFYCQLVK
ncbi:ribosomal protein S18 acetylase RimI-like enzyme [Planomicrobium koreense]|uniref:Ribosomal protein S18 acetylase RimI-like enzyme n=1 Tax=Planococcus koreensis TaxID=112331 RepID=A0A7W8FS96_9BACL|nr:GNAT family N-acetyltransferase [Planococcus koreensis]MBB5180324.1 ribosomal protein S18 acetylase RimI-like enzyme [Planococcus koreensis]